MLFHVPRRREYAESVPGERESILHFRQRHTKIDLRKIR